MRIRIRSKISSKLIYSVFFVFLLFSKTTLAIDLINGGVVNGSISLIGEQDTFDFEVDQGESILINVAAINGSGVEPQLEIISPTGQSLSLTQGRDVGHATLLIETTGIHQLIVRDSSFNNDNTGDYQISFVASGSANELGALANGGSISETITIGDIDSYTFSGSAGDHIIIQAVDVNTTSFTPRLILFGPGGEFIAESTLSNVSQIIGFLEASGTHRVVLLDTARSSSGPNSGGDYEIHFVRSDDVNELGELVNGGFVSESITPGDIDTYTFSGAIGQTFILNAANVNTNNILALDPRIIVYDPAGSVVVDVNTENVTQASLNLESTGIYRVVILDTGGSQSGPDSGGDYEIHFSLSPGSNEHGGAWCALEWRVCKRNHYQG